MIEAPKKGYTMRRPKPLKRQGEWCCESHLLSPPPFPFLIFLRRLGRMFSLFYVPLFASAVLGASPFHSRDFHHQIARSLASNNVSTTNSTNSTVDMVAAAYYTGWHAANFTLDDVSWEKYTHLIYAFG